MFMNERQTPSYHHGNGFCLRNVAIHSSCPLKTLASYSAELKEKWLLNGKLT